MKIFRNPLELNEEEGKLLKIGDNNRKNKNDKKRPRKHN